MPTPNIDRLADEGMTVLLVLRPAELHAGPRRHADRPHPEPQRHDDRRLPGPGRRPAGGGVDARLGAEDRRLQDLLHRQVAPRRGRLRAAQRPGLRRDEVRRPLSPQRLHLRRPDLVPGHGPGAAGDVPAGDQGRAVGQGRASRPRRTSRSTASTSTRPRQGAWSAFPSSTATSRRPRSTTSTRHAKSPRAVLHEHQLHEGAPAEHAAPGLHPQVDVQEQVRRLGGRARRPHRPHHGQGPRARPRQEHAGLLHHRQRRLAGRLSRRRLHAVPRHQGHRARRRQPRAGDRLDARARSRPARRTTTSSAAST